MRGEHDILGIFDPSHFMVETALHRAPLAWADSNLGKPIVGFKNEDGHALFLIAAKEIAPCGECKDPKGVYIIEEVDHSGSTRNYAHVCTDCVPQSMWPQGD